MTVRDTKRGLATALLAVGFSLFLVGCGSSTSSPTVAEAADQKEYEQRKSAIESNQQMPPEAKKKALEILESQRAAK